MKKLKSIAIESDNLVANSRSAVYQLRGHEKYEYKSLPVDYSLLRFTEYQKREKLITALYLDSDSNELSEEFKSNMIYFFVFTISYILILLTFSLLFFHSGSLSSSHLKIHLIILLTLLTLSICSAIILCKSHKTRSKTREIFLGLCLSMSIYEILCRNRILNQMTGESASSSDLPLSLGLLSGIVMIRYVLFDHFLYILIIGMVNSILFTTSNLAISGYNSYEIFSECAVIFLFNIIQITDCYRCDLRIKQIFIRREKEESNELSQTRKNESFLMSGINTEAEYVLSTCSIISSNLKKVSRVVIFKDVKKLLKESLTELDKIKKKLALGAFDNNKVELNPGIDFEDQAFIRENFMQIEHLKGPERRYSLISETIVQPSMLELSELDSLLATFGKNWSFNIFFLHETVGLTIPPISKYLLNKWDITGLLGISAKNAGKYFAELEKSYHNNAYHNACHASDVLHSLIFYLSNSSLYKHLTSLDFFSVIISALGHDVGHPGLTNRYLINTRHPFSLEYNDSSVLENMHCSLTFTLGSKPKTDIFSCFKSEDWLTLRKLIISMILETDMSKHFDVLAKFKTRAILLSDLDFNIIDDKACILAMALKCADVSHCAKDVELHTIWSQLIMDEFFTQGDLEKQNNFSVSMYCDRETADFSKTQIGFLKNICLPLFEIWSGFLNSEIIEDVVLNQLKRNLSYWESKKKNRQATEIVNLGAFDFFQAKKRNSHF